ncbi:MAG TPA: surface-adhesin E family protein, partial [Edaphobacter sp.]|nr:surface-adhesin E family protein [Edaphobacter sp.]
TIVGAPQSVMYDIEGNCDTRTYHLLGSLYFADKNRAGLAMESSPAEGVERKLIPNSALERAFDMLCKLSSER